MKKYNTPFVAVICLEKEDILTLSGNDVRAANDDEANMPIGW